MKQGIADAGFKGNTQNAEVTQRVKQHISLKKDPGTKRHLSMFCRDATWPAELIQDFVSFFSIASIVQILQTSITSPPKRWHSFQLIHQLIQFMISDLCNAQPIDCISNFPKLECKTSSVDSLQLCVNTLTNALI